MSKELRLRILNDMVDVMPFRLSDKIIPYIDEAMKVYAQSKLREAEEERLFLSKRFTKEKRKANNAIYKLNKLKGFSEVEDSFDSFSGRSYVNIRYTDKTVLEIQSIRNMILDLNQQDNE